MSCPVNMAAIQQFALQVHELWTEAVKNGLPPCKVGQVLSATGAMVGHRSKQDGCAELAAKVQAGAISMPMVSMGHVPAPVVVINKVATTPAPQPPPTSPPDEPQSFGA